MHCKHGTYIGNIFGPDIMCGRCEMSDPDPTIADMRDEIGYLTERVEDSAAIFEAMIGRGISPAEVAQVVKINTERDTERINHLNATIAKARQFATSDHDDDWMQAAYEVVA